MNLSLVFHLKFDKNIIMSYAFTYNFSLQVCIIDSKCKMTIFHLFFWQATGKVNPSRNQFIGMISMDVQEDDLIDSFQKEKSAKAKPALPGKGAKPEVSVSNSWKSPSKFAAI